MSEPIELGRPHLMLSHLRGDDGLTPCQAVDLLDHVLGLDHILGGLVVQGMFRRESTDLLQPGFPSGSPHIPLLLEEFNHTGQDVLGVTHYGDVHGHVLAD